MGKINLTRGGATRGVSSIRGRTRGNTSVRGPSTSKNILATRGGGASPINTVATRGSGGSLTNRGKGKESLQRTKDENIEKNASKKSEKKVYKVSLTNAVVKKLIAAKSKGTQMKINASDKMEIYAGGSERIQLNLSIPKKAEMIFIRNDDTVVPVGSIIGFANNAISLSVDKKAGAVKKILKESYQKETKRKVQVLELNKLPSEQETKTKPKRQKNNAGSSIKVQQSPPTAFSQALSSKVSLQISNTARGGGKPSRGKARGGRTRTSVTVTEVADVDDVAEATTTTARGVMTRGGKTTGSGKSTRNRSVKTDAPKAALAAQSTRGKRGRPAGTNRTTRGAKTYSTITTRTSSASFKTSKNDNEQSSEGTASSSSKKEKGKGKGKANGKSSSLSEWRPGQTITILAEFRQARKICEDMENDIQAVIKKIENLSEYENLHNHANSIKSIKGPTQDLLLLKDIEKQFGEGSPANELIQKYSQLEKDIKIIYDELWRAANEGPVYED